MTPKQLEKYFMRNARYYEGGLWNGNAPRPRYAIRTPAPMRKLLTADDVAALRDKFDAYMFAQGLWEDEGGMTRQDYDELDPPEGGEYRRGPGAEAPRPKNLMVARHGHSRNRC